MLLEQQSLFNVVIDYSTTLTWQKGQSGFNGQVYQLMDTALVVLVKYSMKLLQARI